MDKYIVGYIGDEGLAIITPKGAQQNTHLNVAFGVIENGEIVVNLQNLDNMKRIRKYNPKIKILLSIGGWAADGFSQAAATREGRERFSQSAVKIVRQYNFDGIDIDWEYPCHSESGIVSSPRDKYTFTLFMKSLREALTIEGNKKNRYYWVTVTAGADDYFTMATEMNKVQQYVDFVEILTYDMRGGFQTLTGHHTNLYNNVGDLFTPSCAKATCIFENAGVPKEKVIIGSAFYARIWNNVPNVNNGLFQLSDAVAGFGPGYTELEQDYINKNGYEEYWDNMSKASYLFNGSSFLTYDDPKSIRYKCEFIKKSQIKGICYWLYELDPGGVLLDALYRGLNCKKI